MDKDDNTSPGQSCDAEASQLRRLTPGAQRALAEAEARRQAQVKAHQTKADVVPEIGGRDGLDPARYGDWEVKGIASDF